MNKNPYFKKCFESSFEVFLTFLENGYKPLLVHANIFVENKILAHAWVEVDNTIIDLTQDENSSQKKGDRLECHLLNFFWVPIFPNFLS